MIEVLVVVAIIALLVAILLPSLRRAREQAKATMCLGNMKQVGLTITYYAEQYDGFAPPYRIPRRVNPNPNDAYNIPYWFQYLPYMYLHNATDVALCPSDELETPSGGPKASYPKLSRETTQAPGGSIQVSYTMNPNRPRKSFSIYSFRETSPDPPVAERFNPGRLSLLKRPSEFMYFLESDGHGLLNPNSPIDLYRVDHGTRKSNINLTFGDGHAEPRAIDQVWAGNLETRQIESPVTEWPGAIRKLWYGDPTATAALTY